MLIAKIQNSKSENCMANITLRRGGIWSLTEPPQKTFSNTTTKENSRSHNPCHHLLAWLRPRRRILLARQQQQQQPVEDQRCTGCNAHCTYFHGVDVQTFKFSTFASITQSCKGNTSQELEAQEEEQEKAATIKEEPFITFSPKFTPLNIAFSIVFNIIYAIA